MTKIKPVGIHAYMSYMISELTERLNVDERTITRWMEIGLRAIPGGERPLLFRGEDVKAFLKEKDAKKKAELKRNQIRGVAHKKPRHSKQASRQDLGNRKTKGSEIFGAEKARTNEGAENYYMKPLF